VLERFQVSNPTRPRNVPLATGTRLSKTEGEPLSPELSKLYKEIVGSLLYLSVCTRPDMAQSVGMLCRYMATPTSFHMAAARNVLVHLAGTRTLGLYYGRQTPDTTLVGYSDSDYAGDVDNRRSTTGFVFVMNGAVVAWSSRLQHTVATSTTEAEYMAACYACKAAMWERKLLGDLGIPSRGPLLIMGDNQACLKLVGNPIASGWLGLRLVDLSLLSSSPPCQISLPSRSCLSSLSSPASRSSPSLTLSLAIGQCLSLLSFLPCLSLPSALCPRKRVHSFS